MKKIFRNVQVMHKTSKGKTVLLAIIICIFVVILGFIFPPKHIIKKTDASAYDKLPLASNSAMQQMQMSQLQIELQFQKDNIQVLNNERTDLQQCIFSINPGMVQKGFSITRPVLPAHKKQIIPYTTFMQYGIHLNPDKNPVHELVVMCKGPQMGWQYFRNN